MKAISPDHPINISLNPQRVRVLAEGHVVADTGQALTLREADYPPVHYLPREDVEMGFLSRTDKQTTCPYKGVASYYTLHIEGKIFENAVWSYEEPYPAMQAIQGRLAFYPDKVKVYEVSDAAVNG